MQEDIRKRARSWRNPNLAVKNAADDTSESTIKTEIQKIVPRKVGRSQRKHESSRSPTTGLMKHSYSPRYIEFLHNSPHNSPRDKEMNIKIQSLPKKPLWGERKKELE